MAYFGKDFFPELYTTAWYDVAALMEGPTDKVREKYGKHPWIWEFVPPVKSASGLQATRREFDMNPTLTLDIMRSFWVAFAHQEIGIQMCKQSEHRTCFLFICNGLRKEISRLGSSLNTTTRDEGKVTYDFSDISGVTNKDYVAEHTKVSGDIIARLKAHDDTSWTPSAISDVTEQRRKFLRNLLEEAREYWTYRVNLVIEEFHHLVGFASAQRQGDLSSYSPFVPIHEKPKRFPESIIVFQRNLMTFTEMMTGHPMEATKTTKTCLQQLLNTSAAKSQHLQPILEEIGRLRDTVETQRQIITSLGYRRLIEHLPNKLHYDRTLALQPHEKNSTRYWCEVWRGLVVQELNNMINQPPGTPATPPRPLTQLFNYNFEAWRNKGKNKSATVVPRNDYVNWPGYKRGLQLYGELSGTIHQYNDTSRQLYNIKDLNWSRSDRAILTALQPSHFVTLPDGSSDVDWDQERQKHGLP